MRYIMVAAFSFIIANCYQPKFVEMRPNGGLIYFEKSDIKGVAHKSEQCALNMARWYCAGPLKDYTVTTRHDVVAETQEYKYVGEQTIEYIIEIGFLDFECKYARNKSEGSRLKEKDYMPGE